MLRSTSSLSRLVLVSTLGLCACVPEPEVTRTDAAQGRSLFVSQCAACHGEDGRGAGPASLGLGGPPPGLTTLSQRNDGVFPRDYVMAVIDGFNRRDHPLDAMPEFGAGDMGPLVQVETDGISTPIPADLLALANYVETLQE